MRIAIFPRVRVRTLMIAVAVVGLALFGLRLYGRWSYHRRITQAVEEYRVMAERVRQNAKRAEGHALDAEAKAAGQSDTELTKTAVALRRDADLQRRQAEYFEELFRLSEKGAARPWYRSDPIPLPRSLMHPPSP